MKNNFYFGGNFNGEVAEWSKARAWKVRKLQKGFAGSNPALSAVS